MESLDLFRYGLEEQKKKKDIELHIMVFHEGHLQEAEI